MDSVPIPIWAAVIALLGSAVLAPLVSRLLDAFITRRSSLLADVSIYRAMPNPLFVGRLSELRETLEREVRYRRIEEDARLTSLDGFVEIKIKNNASKKISNLTLRIGDSDSYFAQLPGSAPQWVDKYSSIKLGDLQARQEFEIAIWVSYYAVRFADESLFKFGADELHGVKIRYPLQGYLRTQRRNRILRAFTFIWFLWVGGICALVVYGMFHPK